MELKSQLHNVRSGSRSHSFNLREDPEVFDEFKENSKVYVAVPKDVQEWMENLMYFLKNIDKNLLIVFLHVHQPSKLIETPLGLMPEKDVSRMFVSKHRNLEKKKMNECLDKYVHTCSQNKFNATTLYVDNDDIAMGLLELIRQHKVTILFMGAGSAKNFYFWPNSKAKEPNSTIAKIVRHNAEPSCRIHFIRNGKQICIREPFQNDPDASNLPKSKLETSSDHFMQIRSQSPPPSEAKQTIPSRVNYESPLVNVVADASFPTGFPNPSGSEDSSSSASSSHQNFVSDVDSQTSDSHPATPHIKYTSTFQRITEDIATRYEEAMPEAEKFNREACEESSQHSNANQDLIQANIRAENELMKNNELLSSLISQNAQLWQTINQLHAKFEETSAFMEKLTQERDIALREAQQLKRHGSSSPLVNCTKFSYSEIRKATKNFNPSHMIGKGGFGAVYKGFLRHARVAIKISNRDSTQGDRQFYQEIKILSLIRHPHLVTLIGACLEARALVYEYHELASLDKHLTYKDRIKSLPWRERVRIALEICSALIFLHSLHVVHGDLKPENVLLDSNFTVKLSDFGICQEVHVTNVTTTPHHITDHPKGTFPYIDPEYLRTGELTPQYDVYSFGIVLLQLVTGKGAIELKKKIEDAIKKHKIEKMVDPCAGWPLEQSTEDD